MWCCVTMELFFFPMTTIRKMYTPAEFKMHAEGFKSMDGCANYLYKYCSAQTSILTNSISYKLSRFSNMEKCEAVKSNGGWSMTHLHHTADIPKFLLFSLHCSQLTNPLLSLPSIVWHSWSQVSPIRGRRALESHPAMSVYISVWIIAWICHWLGESYKV